MATTQIVSLLPDSAVGALEGKTAKVGFSPKFLMNDVSIPVTQYWTGVAAGAAQDTVATIALTGAAQDFTVVAQPDVPRPLTFVTAAGEALGKGFTVKGYDCHDRKVTETFVIPAGGSYVTQNAFKTISSIRSDSTALVVDPTNLQVQRSNLLGLKLPANSAAYGLILGASDGVATAHTAVNSYGMTSDAGAPYTDPTSLDECTRQSVVQFTNAPNGTRVQTITFVPMINPRLTTLNKEILSYDRNEYVLG